MGRGDSTAGSIRPRTRGSSTERTPCAARRQRIILPSLAHGVVVTAAGTLTDLTWVDGSLAGPEIGPLQVQTPRPHIAARNLAAPPASPLAANQAPAVVSAADGTRDVYVLGQDGAVYAAHSAPTVAGITWHALGAPPAVSLAGGVAAALLPTALMVGAISTDGNLWWRAGPTGNLSGWASVGHPAGTLLVGPPVLLGEPGTGLPLAVAMGRDGKLYENSWSSSTSASASPDLGWGQWTALSLPTGASGFAPPLFAVSELATPHSRIGQWADVSVDLLARTAAGQAWLLRRDASAIWTFRTLGTEKPVERLLGAIVVPSAATGAGASLPQVYVADDKDILLGTLAVGQSNGSASPAPWTTLGPLWQDPSTPTPGSVIALGPHLSMLALASDDKVALVGTEEARSLVADQTAATLAQPIPGATNAIFAPAVP